MSRDVGFVLIAFGLSMALFVPSVFAVEPDEVLSDPALEARARELSANLRCVVCQNQSIDDSDAPLARDLRLLVRERLKAGDTDDEVIAYLVARYSEFVLLRPTFGLHTLVLWLAPIGVLALALYLAFGVLRRHAADREQVASSEPTADETEIGLSVVEEQQLQALLLKKSGSAVGSDDK